MHRGPNLPGDDREAVFTSYMPMGMCHLALVAYAGSGQTPAMATEPIVVLARDELQIHRPHPEDRRLAACTGERGMLVIEFNSTLDHRTRCPLCWPRA